MRRRCRNDTSEISADYACSKSRVNVSHSHRRPSRKCQRTARRAGAVKARPSTRNVVAVGADQRCLDGAEHRAILSYVMAENLHIKSARMAKAFTPIPRRIHRPLGRTNTGSNHQGVSDPNLASQGEAETRPGVAHALVSVDCVPNSPCTGGKERRPMVKVVRLSTNRDGRRRGAHSRCIRREG